MDSNVVTAGTQTDLVANMGGPLATLNTLSGAMVASNKAYCAGSFASTATTTFAQTVATPSAATPATSLIGYGTTRGDGVKATLTLSTNTGLTGISLTGNGARLENLTVDCNSLGTSVGFNLGPGAYNAIRSCKSVNFTSRGILGSGNSSATSITKCEITGGSSAATACISANEFNYILFCNIHDNACPGIIFSGEPNVVENCLITNNTGSGNDGIVCQYGTVIKNNTIHGNGRHGIFNNSSLINGNEWQNNILTSNGGFGIVGTSSTALPAQSEYDGNAFYNNTSGTRSLMDSTAGVFGINPYVNVRDVILTGLPYVNAAGGNYALNNAAGQGAAVRGKGTPGAFPGLATTTGFLDMGAVQSQGATNPPQIIGGM
jgi:hypothetical protein